MTKIVECTLNWSKILKNTRISDTRKKQTRIYILLDSSIKMVASFNMLLNETICFIIMLYILQDSSHKIIDPNIIVELVFTTTLSQLQIYHPINI